MLKSLSLVWIDLEMTGLDPDRDRILEIATVVTDAELNVIGEGPELVLHQSNKILDGMDEWNTSHHGSSGLLTAVRQSDVDESRAEAETLAFLSCHLEPGVSPMCGNSVHQDRRFLSRFMPELTNFFHYRNLDVSTLKELARRWRPDLLAGGERKQSLHRALADTYESIEELRRYRQHFLRAN